MNERLPVSTDPEVMSGKPVFAGTRVPVETLLDYIVDGHTLGVFLDNFPTVKREDAVRVLEHFKAAVLTGARG
jgi:uncharacterized protein (DUF433 family)